MEATWITERLPEKTGMYLVTYEHTLPSGQKYRQVEFENYVSFEDVHEWCTEKSWKKVVAWRHLPTKDESGWTLYKEQTPKEGKYLIVEKVGPSAVLKAGPQIVVAKANYNPRSPWYKDKVLAWQPLPEPFEG